MTIVEKAAYLKGLTEGLGVDPETREGKLWNALNELLSDMAHEIEELQSSNMDFAEALDEISEDLSYLEELTCDLDTPEDADDYDDYEGCPGSCASCAGCEEDEDDGIIRFSSEEDEEDEELAYDGVVYDVTCPSCGEEISFDEETLEKGSIVCPSCGETLEFDLSDEEE